MRLLELVIAVVEAVGVLVAGALPSLVVQHAAELVAHAFLGSVIGGLLLELLALRLLVVRARPAVRRIRPQRCDRNIGQQLRRSRRLAIERVTQRFHQVVVGHRLACPLGVLLATVEHVLHVRDDLGVVLLREVWRVAEPAHQLAHHPAPELHAPRRAQRLAAALDQLHHLRLG